MFLFWNKRNSISDLENILEEKNVKNLIANSVESVANKLEEKFKISQEDTECSRKKYLIYDLDYLRYADCNLGCQLHGFSSGLLCATEQMRHYSVINFYKDQFESYFSFFKQSCMINEQIKLSGKLGTSL